MNTKEINAKLKEAGLGFVKINTPESWDIDDGKCHVGWDGKRSKGIRGGSIGPMTMTDAHRKHNNEIEDLLKQYFPDNYSFDGVNSKLTFNMGKVTKVYTFIWKLFPTNSKSMDLDDGYQTFWYVPTIKEVKN